jgi:hypothetical protein
MENEEVTRIEAPVRTLLVLSVISLVDPAVSQLDMVSVLAWVVTKKLELRIGCGPDGDVVCRAAVCCCC